MIENESGLKSLRIVIDCRMECAETHGQKINAEKNACHVSRFQSRENANRETMIESSSRNITLGIPVS